MPVLFCATQLMACVICLEGGDANIEPAMAAVSIPVPTKPIQINSKSD